MTTKLWGCLSSCNVQKAMWAIEEVGLAYERIDFGGDFGGLDDPACRVLDPHGKVPTLQDGDIVIWESNAIVRYLAPHTHPAHYGLRARLTVSKPICGLPGPTVFIASGLPCSGNIRAPHQPCASNLYLRTKQACQLGPATKSTL